MIRPNARRERAPSSIPSPPRRQVRFDLDRHFREDRSWMVSMACGYLGREVAEEAVQETFLKAHRARNGFLGHSRTRTRLYRILVNECLTRVAKRKREVGILYRHAQEASSGCGAFWENGDRLARDRA